MSGITEKMLQDLPYTVVSKVFQKVCDREASSWDTVEFGSELSLSDLKTLIEPYGVFSDISTAVQKAVQRMPFNRVIFDLNLPYDQDGRIFAFKLYCMLTDVNDLILVGVVYNNRLISMYTLKRNGNLTACFTEKDFINKKEYGFAKNFFETTAQLLVGMITYIAEYRTDPVIVSSSEVKQKVTQGNKHKKKKRNKVTLTRTRYVVTPERSSTSEKVKGSIVRHTDAWTVRGHHRKLASGKEIFIKPYIKGKDKSNVVPKTYNVQKD